jgi:hypothetical protein
LSTQQADAIVDVGITVAFVALLVAALVTKRTVYESLGVTLKVELLMR